MAGEPTPNSTQLQLPTSTSAVAQLPTTTMLAPTVAPPVIPSVSHTPTLSPTPTVTPIFTPIPSPTVPQNIYHGEITYPVPSGGYITQLISLFSPGMLLDMWTFYNGHPEIWCSPGTPTPTMCIKAANLNLKWEELNPSPVGLTEAQKSAGRLVWLAIYVDDNALSVVRGVGDLAPHKIKLVLLRGRWQAGLFNADPVNLLFVWNEQIGKYVPAGQAPASPTSRENQIEKEKIEPGDPNPPPNIPATK